MSEQDNPIMEWVVSALGFVCLVALSVQTWFFIDWLMGPSEWWMKYITLSFFDIFGGIWLTLGLFHMPPSKGTFQAQKAGVVVCFLLSAATTVAWCFIFITRTPLTKNTVAGLVDTARWLVVFAVLFNAFLMIFYSVATAEYHQRIKNPHKKRWATEGVSLSRNAAKVALAQTNMVDSPPNNQSFYSPPSTNKRETVVVEEDLPEQDEQVYSPPRTNKKKLPRMAGGKTETK